MNRKQDYTMFLGQERKDKINKIAKAKGFKTNAAYLRDLIDKQTLEL